MSHIIISLEAFVVIEFNEIFFGQTVVSGCKGFRMFRQLTPSPSSGYSTRPPAYPEYGEGVDSKTLENLYVLTGLCDRDNFIVLLLLLFFYHHHRHHHYQRCHERCWCHSVY